MFKRIRSKVGIKLLLTFSIVLVLSLVSLNFLATRSISQFGKFSADTTEASVKQYINAFLFDISAERAGRYTALFQRIGDSSAMLARWAGFLADHQSLFQPTDTGQENNLSLYPPNGIFSNLPTQKIMVLYWGSTTVSPDITAQLNTFARIDPFLEETRNTNPESVSAFIVTHSAIGRYYPNIHSITRLDSPTEHDMRSDPFFVKAAPEQNPEKKTIWTGIYQDPSGLGLVTTAATPIYGKNGDFLGVTGINITLNTIIREVLVGTDRSQDQTIEGAFSFFIDQKGTIIAMPPEHFPRFNIPVSPQALIGPGVVLDVSLMQSGNNEVIQLCRNMISKPHHATKITLKGRSYFISSQYLPQTGWRFGFAVPEAVVMSSVYQTREALAATVKKMNTLFLIVTITFLLFSVLVVIAFLYKNIIKPVGILSDAAQMVREGNLSFADLEIRQRDEIGVLAASFNNMVTALRKSWQNEKEYARTLEEKVDERTAEIQEKAEQLQKTLRLLKKEMTEKEMAETALRESEEKFKSLGENAPDIIYTLSVDGKYSYVNVVWEELLGHARSEVIGRNFTAFLKSDEIQGYETYFRNVIVSKETIRDKVVTLIHQNGTEKIFSMSGAPNFNLKGMIIGVVGLFKDITGQRKLEEQLQQAQKMESIGTLTSGVAHNFRNIMASVMANNQLLQMKYKNDPKIKRYTESIAGAVQRGAQLVDGLMHFSRKEGKQQTGPVNLAQIILETYQLIAVSFDKSINITLDIPEPIFIEGIPSALSQVFMNLSTNARDAMPEGGDLLIEARANDQKAIVIFSDTGHGMNKEVAEQCFDPFFTTKEVNKGTGLGLSTTYGIVKDHGGDIHVYSEPGKGTVFKLYFPLTYMEDFPEPNPDVEISEGRGEKILMVDDEVDILEPVQVMLEEINYKVMAVTSGGEAIEMYQSWKPDVVLMDRNMPGMDGITCAKKILEYDPKAKIILISGYVDRGPNGIDPQIKSLLKGYLTKPFQLKELDDVFTRIFYDRR
jgi:PAS domain S-box-containing protein